MKGVGLSKSNFLLIILEVEFNLTSPRQFQSRSGLIVFMIPVMSLANARMSNLPENSFQLALHNQMCAPRSCQDIWDLLCIQQNRSDLERKLSWGFIEVFREYLLCFSNSLLFKFSFIVINIHKEVKVKRIILSKSHAELSEQLLSNGLFLHDVLIVISLQNRHELETLGYVRESQKFFPFFAEIILIMIWRVEMGNISADTTHWIAEL